MTTNSSNNNLDWKTLLLIIIYAVILTFVLIAMSGCKCKQHLVAPVEPEIHYQHDTIKTIERHDSIIHHYTEKKDSSSFRQHGDTVRIEHWHWERDYSYEKVLEAKLDSFAHLKRDSVPYPVPVEVSVPAEIKRWQKGLMWWGVIITLALCAYIYIRVRFPKARHIS